MPQDVESSHRYSSYDDMNLREIQVSDPLKMAIDASIRKTFFQAEVAA